MSLFESTIAGKTPRFTIEQYLKLERAADERHEYLDGVIYDMAGESRAHGQITMNLAMLVGTQLKGTPCQAFLKDTRVFSDTRPPDERSIKGMFSYPDLVIVCGEPESLDDKLDVILNPVAVIEVLSPSTEAFERGKKFFKYQVNSSLKEYVLVSQDRPHIDVYFRGEDKWIYESTAGLDRIVALKSVKCKLPFVDVYDRVEFSPENLE